MTLVVLAAVGSVCGIVGLGTALRPRVPSLDNALACLDRDPDTVAPVVHGRAHRARTRVDVPIAAWLASMLERHPDTHDRLKPALAITGTTLQELCGHMILGASAGLVLPGLWWVVVGAGGIRIPPVFPVWAGVALGVGGGVLPLGVLRAKARRARRFARRVVGSFLNLVALCLAGGMGIEGAMYAASHIGEDEVSRRIGTALALARDAGEPPWQALDHLGGELGLTELKDLAAAIGLAGTEGARVRTTLVAKAASIRRHDLADAESEANAVTERLFLPGVILLVGFLIFVAYPAVVRIAVGI